MFGVDLWFCQKDTLKILRWLPYNNLDEPYSLSTPESNNIIYWKLEQDISENQFGFRNGFWTREREIDIYNKCDRSKMYGIQIFMYVSQIIIKLKKLYHKQLIEILKQLGFKKHHHHTHIKPLFWQSAAVQINEEMTDEIETKREVRQRCVPLSILFYLYS